MKRSSTLDRRRFLQAAATSAAGSAIACSNAGRRYRFLTGPEAATLAAICNQIVPPDDYPGAADAGAVDFIDRQLAGHYSRWQEEYRRGIAEFEDAARRNYGKPFAGLSSEPQIGLLKQREETAFFRMVRDHTMQSYYGDPRHGGNRDAVSWRMLGVPNPPVRGRDQYDLTES